MDGRAEERRKVERLYRYRASPHTQLGLARLQTMTSTRTRTSLPRKLTG